MIAPVRGLRFEHARQIVGSPKQGTARPEVCTVTRVNAYTVWFRNESGFLSTVARDRFPEAVRRVL